MHQLKSTSVQSYRPTNEAPPARDMRAGIERRSLLTSDIKLILNTLDLQSIHQATSAQLVGQRTPSFGRDGNPLQLCLSGSYYHLLLPLPHLCQPDMSFGLITGITSDILSVLALWYISHDCLRVSAKLDTDALWVDDRAETRTISP